LPEYLIYLKTDTYKNHLKYVIFLCCEGLLCEPINLVYFIIYTEFKLFKPNNTPLYLQDYYGRKIYYIDKPYILSDPESESYKRLKYTAIAIEWLMRLEGREILKFNN
jgi:hypothetical protein